MMQTEPLEGQKISLHMEGPKVGVNYFKVDRV